MPAADAITSLLGSMNANQLLDLMTQMKVFTREYIQCDLCHDDNATYHPSFFLIYFINLVRYHFLNLNRHLYNLNPIKLNYL